jgi:ABC-2 type transport system ATP-binding protein
MLQPRDLLILDEPTNGLDPQGTREVRHLVQSMASEGTTVLVSSHLLAEVEQVATHVGIMSAGRLIAQGPLADVLGGSTATLVVTTPDADRAREVLARLGFDGVTVTDDPNGDAARVSALLGDAQPEDVNRRLVEDGVRVAGLTLLRPTLEDLFVSLTGEGFDVAH